MTNMPMFNVHQAKTHLSKLLERVERGEEIVIARGGEPVARLVRVRGQRRRPGRLAGKIEIGADFDAPLPAELLAAFEGEEE